MSRAGRDQCGATVLEVMIASTILIVASLGLLAAFGVGVRETKSQGEIATRTTDLARAKMEQLLALDFDDGTSNTCVSPTTATGGSGLGGTMAANATVGGINPSTLVTSYVDYFDQNGNLLTGSTSSFFVRQWSISTGASTTLKTITVRTFARASGGLGAAPSTTLVSIKTDYP